MCSMWNVDTLVSNSKYLVVDDCKLTPAFKPFWFGQREFEVTDKYRHKRHVTWGKPTIWLCNEGADPIKEEFFDEDWLSNCIIVRTNRKFF